MDSGLGVRWPLSPYATALAAGALFAFCFALWKHHSSPRHGSRRGLSGLKFGKNLEPNKEQDVCEKCDQKKDEEKTEKTQNFSVVAFRDFPPGFRYENHPLSGQFGAIPRITQRNQPEDSRRLYSVLRRRSAERESKYFPEINPISSSFSCIYQKSFCFGNELPGLNARFILNVSPHLHPYIKQFYQLRDLQLPSCSRGDFENFDVAIRPEILKDKPITRSAVCLTLEKTLHRILSEEQFHEAEFIERAIQTADILDENGDNCAASSSENAKEQDSHFDINHDAEADNLLTQGCDKLSKTIGANSSLWDSGYCERTFDERCSTPRDMDIDEGKELIVECSNVFRNISATPSGDLNAETSIELSNQICDDVFIYSSKIQNNFNSDISSKLEHDQIDETIHSAHDSDDLKSREKKVSEKSEKDFGCEENINISFDSKFLDQKLEQSSTENQLHGMDEKKLKNNSSYGDSEKDVDYATVDTGTNIFDEAGNLSDSKQINSSDENIFQRTDSNISIQTREDSVDSSTEANIEMSLGDQCLRNLHSNFENLKLENFYETFSVVQKQQIFDGDLFPDSENISAEEKTTDLRTRAFEVDVGEGKDKTIKHSTMNLANSDLEGIQNAFDSGEKQNDIALSPVLETEQSERSRPRVTGTAVPARDVTEEASSRDLGVFDEKGIFCTPRQMDRETGERSVAVESTVTTETTLRANGDARLSTAVVSRLTLDDWSAASPNKEDSVSVRTTVSEEVFRPTFEEFVPLKSSEKIYKTEVCRNETFDELIQIGKTNGEDKPHELPKDESPSSPRVDRLKGLLNRDEERRSRSKYRHLADSSHVGGAMEGEWDRLLRDVLASVSELERWERQHRDVSSDAEDAEQQHHFSQSDSSFTMEEEALSPKGETPTKVKNLRFKLDPDVFDVPSDDSFYDDADDETRRGWKKQPKYRTFSTLELTDEPVRLVSVHASVVPAGQKLIARPVGIDLRVRLTEERQSKRAHVSTSPSQAKRRSPVSDRGIGWCQELSPVTENVDWRETFTPVTPECKSVPNGILKTPSPKTEPPPVESPNPFKLENGVTTNGVSPVTENKPVDKPKQNGLSWKPTERKPFLMPRKKFEPDPEAIERITGYKSALSKPPLPPPMFHKINGNLTPRNKAELARKQYLDNKAALSASRVDGTKKFQQFLNQAQNDRARIVTSVPDLAAIERAVTEQWIKERTSVSPRESPGREINSKPDDITLSRGSTPDDKWASYVQSCRQHLGRRSQSMSYLETDIDVIPVLDEDDKCHSTSALDEPDEALPDPDDSDVDRSREDLDDSGRAKSEHEIRIERSLRSLPVPEWYRRSEKTKTGFLLSSSAKEKRGWAAAKSLASSTSSLASCGLRRPVRSLRSSRENIPWSRSSASPDGPTLSLALAKAFREPYLGWRARTPTSSGVSSSPRASPPSWGATTTDDEANGVSFDGEDAFGRTTSSEEDRRDEPLSLDDTGADAVTVSMDTNDPVKLPGGEDTCDDINNMSMDTCELFDASVVVPVDEDPSPQADTGDDIDNLSTDTTTTEGRKLDAKLKRYSYSQSIYHSEWEEEEESRGDRKGKEEERDPSPSSPDHKVVWIESSFVGSRTTTSIMVLPEKKAPGSAHERPASR